MLVIVFEMEDGKIEYIADQNKIDNFDFDEEVTKILNAKSFSYVKNGVKMHVPTSRIIRIENR